jgi:hypothetical protein
VDGKILPHLKAARKNSAADLSRRRPAQQN